MINVSAPKNRTFVLSIEGKDFKISNLHDNIAENLLDEGIRSMEDDLPYGIEFITNEEIHVKIVSDEKKTDITYAGESYCYEIPKKVFLTGLCDGISAFSLEWVLPPNYHMLKTHVSENEYIEIVNQKRPVEEEFKTRCNELMNLLTA